MLFRSLIALLSIFGLLVTNQCQSQSSKPDTTKSDWRYEIHGYVKWKGKPHHAIWLTDTIEVDQNSLRYQNSDGSIVVIQTPYVLIDHKYDTKVHKGEPIQ